PSPVCRRTVACVVESRKTATPPLSPRTTPIRLRFGCSGAGGGGGGGRGGGGATGAATPTGVGARREEENRGRSRVAASALSGTDQRGLPPATRTADDRGASDVTAGPV